MKKKKLVCGIGVNDVDYVVQKVIKVDVDTQHKTKGTCPYYRKWKSVLERCFSEKFGAKNLTYEGCTVDTSWLSLLNFIKWVDQQPNRDWMNCQLDKDLLCEGNKHYSQETCVFVPKALNTFLTNSSKARGKLMLGVDLVVKGDWVGYKAQCNDPFKINSRYLGCFKTELEAHKAWQAKKHEYACQLADLQEDPRVAQALRERYAPDKDWTNK